MKNLITLILLLFTSFSFSQDMTVLYMNSNWNVRNDWKGVDQLKRAKILKVDFDSQQTKYKTSNKICASTCSIKRRKTSRYMASRFIYAIKGKCRSRSRRY